MHNNNVVAVVAAVCVAVIGGFVYLTSDGGKKSAPVISSNMDEQFRHFIMNNPEVIEDSLNALSQKRKEFANNKRADYLKDNYDDIVKSTKSPRAGSTEPKHYMIEFFDYNCGWCKKMMPLKDKILAENKDVQIIFMELPILGQYSMLATRAALAVNLSQPDKYIDFHRELLTTKGSIRSQKIIDDALIASGVNMAKYKEAANDPKIDTLISDAKELAINLGVRGTPAYIVDGAMVPGAFSYGDFQKLLK